MKNENLKPEGILRLLEVDAVLIPIKKGTKASSVKGWSKLEFKKTQVETYQRRLDAAPAIAVCLGSQSEGICSIDFDDDSALVEFIAINPSLKTSLTTAGKRGCNIWLKITGDYPRTKKLKRGDEPLGEWRSSGGYTIISGLHPDGVSYKVLVDAPPMSMDFEAINWPGSWTSPQCYINGINGTNVIKNINVIKEKERGRGGATPIKTLVEKEKSANQAREALEKDPKLWKLYSEFIDRRYMPEQGQRNSQLVAMTTFLSFNTADDITTKLVEAFYDLNEDIFEDSKETHSNEAHEQMKNVQEKWMEGLDPADKEILNGFPERQQQAFRILWNLARIEAEDAPRGTFYLSCHQLGRRLGVENTVADRIFKQLQGQGVINVITKGDQYQPGKRAKATSYRWLLSLPSIQFEAGDRLRE